MQEDDKEKDAERAKSVHNTLNNIKDASSTTPAATTTAGSIPQQ